MTSISRDVPPLSRRALANGNGEKGEQDGRTTPPTAVACPPYFLCILICQCIMDNEKANGSERRWTEIMQGRMHVRRPLGIT